MTPYEIAVKEAIETAAEAYPIMSLDTGKVLFGFKGSNFAFVAAEPDASAEDIALLLLEQILIASLQESAAKKIIGCGGLQ